MPRILLTAFEPYETWKTNASWLALIELTRDLPRDVEITTRLYPVELEAMKDKLTTDLKANFDFAFHVGQAPRTSCIQLEELAVNVACSGHTVEDYEQAGVVSEGGAGSYRCPLPIREYAQALREDGIPARVSYHAGTYLCNAILYWSCQLADDLDLPTKATFVHVPLDTSQVLELDEPSPFMPSSMVAAALRKLVHLAAQKHANNGLEQLSKTSSTIQNAWCAGSLTLSMSF